MFKASFPYFALYSIYATKTVTNKTSFHSCLLFQRFIQIFSACKKMPACGSPFAPAFTAPCSQGGQRYDEEYIAHI